MDPTAIIIQQSELDTSTFLAACIEMLGYSPASAAEDQGHRGIEHSLGCLSAFREQWAKPGVEAASAMYDLMSISCLVIADERDMVDLLEVAAMPFAFTETQRRGVQVAFVSGTLRQWRTAILRGCKQEAERHVRACFDTIYLQFRSVGLAPMLNRSQRNLNDNTFLLE